jgi:hypothetical protein
VLSLEWTRSTYKARRQKEIMRKGSSLEVPKFSFEKCPLVPSTRRNQPPYSMPDSLGIMPHAVILYRTQIADNEMDGYPEKK